MRWSPTLIAAATLLCLSKHCLAASIRLKVRESIHTRKGLDNTACLVQSVTGKKVLLLGQDLSLSGPPIVLFNLAHELQRCNATVLLSTEAGALQPSLASSGLSYHIGLATTTSPRDFDLVIVNTLAEGSRRWLRQQVEDYGILFLQKVVWWVHELNTPVDLVTLRLLQGSGAAVFDSAASLEYWKAMVANHEVLWLKETSHFHVITPWVPKQATPQERCDKANSTRNLQRTLRSGEDLHQLGVAASDYVILSVGALEPAKGELELLDALKLLIDDTKELSSAGSVQLIAVGAGSQEYRDKIAKHVDELGIAGHVRFTGPVETPGKYYKRADAFVVNSQCENMGLVTLQAMAFGVPAAGTACGGTKELLDNGAAGLMHEFGDARQLAANLAKLDPRSPAGKEEGRRMADLACQRYLKLYYKPVALPALSELLGKVAAASGPPVVRPDNMLAPPPSRVVWKWQQLPDVAAGVQFNSRAAQVDSMLFSTGTLAGDVAGQPGLQAWNLTNGTWAAPEQPPLPETLPLLHSAAASYKGHVYLMGGQKGSRCGGSAAATSFWYDTAARKWQGMPDLPSPRYAGTAQVLGQRLHYIGGADGSQEGAAAEHWSMQLEADGSTSGAWKAEAAAPVGTRHAASAILNDTQLGQALFVFGGVVSNAELQGAAKGEADCDAGSDRAVREVHAWSAGSWHRRVDMPLGIDHTGSCALVFANATCALLLGGQSGSAWLQQNIWLYNATADTWRVVGRLPQGPVSDPQCAILQNTIYVSSGHTSERGKPDAPARSPVRSAWKSVLPKPLLDGSAR